MTAFAQSSATIPAPAAASAAAPAAATGTSVAEVPTAKSKVSLSYLGIMYGPGLSNELDGKTYGGDVPYFNNRPAIKYNFSDNVDVGLQARFNVRFQGDGLDAVNDPWRVFNNVKNIYKDDVYQFNMLTRAILPTRLKDHDRTMLPSPELLPTLNITPRNSRFNLSIYPQLIRYLYSNNATAEANGANKYIALGNFEGTFQLTGNSAITFGFYPEYIATFDRALYNASNEIDLGYSYDFAKGWTINPFLAVEPVGMGADNAAISKSMAVNMVISGSLL